MPGSFDSDGPTSSPSLIPSLRSFRFQSQAKLYRLPNSSDRSPAICSNSSSELGRNNITGSPQVFGSSDSYVPETPESKNGSLSSREGSVSPLPGVRRKVIKSSNVAVIDSSSSSLSLTTETLQAHKELAMDEYELFCEKEHCLREFLKRHPSADIMEAQDLLVTSHWDLSKALELAKKTPPPASRKRAPQHITTGSAIHKGIVYNNSAVNGTASATQEIVLDSDDESLAPVKTGASVNSTSSAISVKYSQSSTNSDSRKRRRVVCILDSDDDSFLSQQNAFSNISSAEDHKTDSKNKIHSSEFSVLDYQPPRSDPLLQQSESHSSVKLHSTYSKLAPRQMVNREDNSIFTDSNSESSTNIKQTKKRRNQHKMKTGKKKKVCDSDDDMEEDYGNDDVYDSEDSDFGESLTPAKCAVLSFFEDATCEELLTVPGCSKKKVDTIVKYRPFTSWIDLVQKLNNDKALSCDLLNAAKKVLDMRTAVNRLMNKCQRLAVEMGDLVEALKENKGDCKDYVSKQPDLLNANMHLTCYQMLGLNWLLLMHNQEVNGILADEMGLGKTVQAIAFLAYLKEQNIPGPHLVVVPSSTLDNWQNEFGTWWPSASVLCYHGSQESRRELRFQIINDEVDEFDVMVTTYNMVASSAEDRSFFKKLEFHYVIFDEAHMLKNMASQRYQHLMRVKASRRLLLTGTPLQNNLVELMSLLIFAMPHMFSGKTEQIKRMFSSVSKSDCKTKYESERIEHAKRIMKPFVLRRLKSEVLKDLPKKYEEIRLCQMSEEQAKQYTNLVAVLSEEVKKNEETEITTSGAGMMMKLRKAANHPLLSRNYYNDEKLIKMAKLMLKEPTHKEANPDLVFEDMSVMSDFELHNLCKQYKSLKSYILADAIILDSGKFAVLDIFLPDMIEKGHRILLFSQFTMVLDIIEEYMRIRKIKFLRLDGSVPVSERQELIDEYNKNSSIPVFLLSTRAGGLGINLTAADTVLIHDIDFNPYNDKQAEDRCHRVGQQRDVTVIRMISEDTIEEGMLQRAKEKLKLERDVTMINEDEEKNSASVAKLLRDALGLSTSKS